MIESKSFGSKAFKVINAIILILLAFSCFYPLWYTFCVSISSKAAAEGGLVTIYPIGSNVKSYSLIMGDSAFWNSFWISIKRVVIGTIWTMVVLIMMSAGKEQNRVQTEKCPDVDPGILYAVQWWYHSVVHHR